MRRDEGAQQQRSSIWRGCNRGFALIPTLAPLQVCPTAWFSCQPARAWVCRQLAANPPSGYAPPWGERSGCKPPIGKIRLFRSEYNPFIGKELRFRLKLLPLAGMACVSLQLHLE